MRKVFLGMAAALLAVGLTPAPAPARATELTAKAALWQTTVAVGGEDQFAALSGRLSAQDSRSHRLTYTLDYTAITGFAELEFLGYPGDGDFLFPSPDGSPGPDESAPPFDPCETQGTVISCVQTTTARERFVTLGFLTIRATSAATPGDSAKVVVTVQVDDGPETVSRSVVRVGEPVDIAAAGPIKLETLPGKTVLLDPRVRNAGTNPVDGTVFVFAFPRSLFTGTFQNCLYSEYVVCSFDTVLQPGRTYRIADVKLRIPTGAAGGSLLQGGGIWITQADWEDSRVVFEDKKAVPGTGRILRLEPLPGSVAVPQVDIRPDDNFATANVLLSGERPDLAAIGAEVTGAAGDEVTVKVGMVNHGPGTLRPDLFDNNYFVTSVRLPENLEVLSIDKRCMDFSIKGSYECALDDAVMKRNDPVLFTFKVKIRKGSADDGEVSVLGLSDNPLEDAEDEKNNVATIKVKVPTDGAGGGLPVSGPGGFLSLAALLLAGGAGAVLATRRRRGK